MAVLFVRHEVADYDAWKKGYDAAADMQKALGVTVEAVYRHEDDPNVVTVYHEFDSIEAARAMVNDPALKKAMNELGVKGQPEFWFAQRV
jgi:quinol monooxygenase YgiN